MPTPVRPIRAHVRADGIVRERAIEAVERSVAHETIAMPLVTPIAVARLPIEVVRVDATRPIDLRISPAMAAVAFRSSSRLHDLLVGGRKLGVTRAEVKVPIAPTGTVTDTVRFEDPVVPDAFYYLPRYRVATNGAQYAIRLGRRGDVWALTVRLVPEVAEEIGAAGGGQPIEHQVAVTLRYERAVAGGITQALSLVFDEVTREGAEVVATAVLPTIEAKDATYLALLSSTTRLEVARTIRVAIPLVQRPLRPLTMIPHHGLGDRFERVPDLPVLEPAPPAETRYREEHRELLWTAEPQPFQILPDLHPYAFEDVVASIPASAEPVARSVVFEQRAHVYYQDPVERHRFYYLPDSYQLLRRSTVPRAPAMRVELATTGTGLDDMLVSIGYAAGPRVRAGRLAAAVRELEPHLPAGQTTISLEPLMTTNLRLSLALPGAGISYQDRPNVAVELDALSDMIENLRFSDFRALFDAMFTTSSLLFCGVVELGVGDEAAHSIPFTGRMDELIGQVLESSHQPIPASGGALLTLANVIESPVRVGVVAVTLRYGDTAIEGALSDASLPLELAAGASATLTVTPASPPPNGVEPAVELTLDQIEVVPDREAVLESVLQTEVAPEVERVIVVKVPAVMFDPTAADPLLAVVIQFENGSTVDLTAGATEANAVVRTRVSTLLLETADSQAYRYKLEIIRVSSRKRDTEWRTDSFGILYPDPS